MKKCKYYEIFTWAEPPLEPDEPGRKITEGRCKKEIFVNSQEVFCEGREEICDVEKYNDEPYVW